MMKGHFHYWSKLSKREEIRVLTCLKQLMGAGDALWSLRYLSQEKLPTSAIKIKRCKTDSEGGKEREGGRERERITSIFFLRCWTLQLL